jgi:hypothetical protein
MPIRFRCAYCNQLMGIARRKAGTVVRCPKCAGELIVPTPPDQPDAGSDPEINLSAILENAELDRELSVPPEPASPEPPPTAAPEPPSERLALSTDDPVILRPGVFLPRPLLLLLAGLAVLVAGTVFVAGFLVGRWTGPG